MSGVRRCARCGAGAFSDLPVCFLCGYDSTPEIMPKVWRAFLREKGKPLRTFLVPKKGLIVGGGPWCDVVLDSLDPDDASVRMTPGDDCVVIERYLSAASFQGDSSTAEQSPPIRVITTSEVLHIGRADLWVRPYLSRFDLSGLNG